MVMDAREFWNVLKARDLTFFSGVPDSTFQAAYDYMVRDPEIQYVPAVREDVALRDREDARDGRELRHRARQHDDLVLAERCVGEEVRLREDAEPADGDAGVEAGHARQLAAEDGGRQAGETLGVAGEEPSDIGE